MKLILKKLGETGKDIKEAHMFYLKCFNGNKNSCYGVQKYPTCDVRELHLLLVKILIYHLIYTNLYPHLLQCPQYLYAVKFGSVKIAIGKLL